jgi:hypothetical protein
VAKSLQGRLWIVTMASRIGIEPIFLESGSSVLPLDDRAITLHTLLFAIIKPGALPVQVN